jgi:RNA polymerase sigma factor (sigma-70 family)
MKNNPRDCLILSTNSFWKMTDINIPKNIKQISDTEVLQQILTGDTALFEILIRRYNPFLYKTARGYGFNHQDAEDLMQETYINTYQNLSKFRNQSSFKTWIIKIILNQCYHRSKKNNYRKEQTEQIFATNKFDCMFPTNNPNDTSKSVINKELSQVIEAALEKLPENYRITFTLRELSGLNVNETAEVMNTTTSNVKVRMNRAKLMLRKEIEKIYSAEDIYEFNLIYCDKIVDRVMNKILEIKVNKVNKVNRVNRDKIILSL